MRFVAIIPARGGSKGIPQKNIIDFCGKPLISWSIEQACGVDSIEAVYVSTDDALIAKVGEAYGAKIILRPSDLATDFSSSEDALLHALDTIEAEIGLVDVIVFLQATSPLRVSADIEEALHLFVQSEADSLFSGSYVDMMLWRFGENGTLVPHGHDYLSRLRRQDAPKDYHENGSIYIFKPRVLRKNHNRLGGKIVMFESTPYWKMYEIDSLDNLELCAFYASKYLIDHKQEDIAK